MMEERRKNTMILYRNLRYQQLFDDMCSLLKPEEGGARPDAYACASQLIDLAVTYGFRGNLWHCFLAFCMANNENAYSTSCEIIGPVGGSLSELAVTILHRSESFFPWILPVWTRLRTASGRR